jgi:hypothetical protein
MRRAALAALAAVAVALLGYGWTREEERARRDRFQEVRGKRAVLHVPAGRREASAWAAEADRRLETMASRLGVELPQEPLQLFLHDSTITKNAMAGDDAPFTVLADRRAVHHLTPPGGKTGIADPRGDALLLLRLAWGPPGSERLAEAVARWVAGDFHGHPLPAYAARVAREEEPYALREVLSPSQDRSAPQLSPLVIDALGGAWVEWMRQARGAAVVREIWSAPDGSAWTGLESGWRTWLAGLPLPSSPKRRTAAALPFQRGITLAHEGFRTNEGYGSDAALAQLARLKKLGANSVTLVPYGFTRAPEETGVRWLGTDESDDRVARTIQEARRLGLTTVLKPQLWARDRWTGDVAFADEAAFRRWMAAYRRFVLHYARLAELERADLFVIGTELGGLTVHEADWRALIRDVRRVYAGPLTYASNWGKELESLAFWDALDILGVNFNYPLAAPGEEPRAGSPRMKELAAKMEGLSRRHRKPVLFTEVGFAASAAAAVEPWKEGTAELDPEMQARCYEVIFRSFYRQRWLAGLHWWKWPSPGQGDARDPTFSPLGKPALAVLERWYGDPARSR